MKKQPIITVPVLIQQDVVFFPEEYADGAVIDFAFKNIGTTDVTLYNNFPLAVGDGLISFPGYKDKIRKDSIPIAFATGTGRLMCFITKYLDKCDVQ